MRKLLLAALLAIGLVPSFVVAQAPPPVPALPDTARLTTYSITAQTGPFNVGFALYGDGTDYQNWAEVWLNGAKLTPVTDWTMAPASGTFATLSRPITNGQVTLTVASTGTLQIVGSRRPRRTSQFAENRGVAARDLNQVITDLTAVEREIWDLKSRMILTLPGVSGGFISSLSIGLGNVLGPPSSVDGHIALFNGTSGIILKDAGAASTGLLTHTFPGTLGGPIALSSLINEQLDLSGYVAGAATPTAAWANAVTQWKTANGQFLKVSADISITSSTANLVIPQNSIIGINRPKITVTTGTTAFNIDGSSSGYREQYLRNLILAGNTGTTVAGLYVNGITQFLAEDLEVRDIATTAIGVKTDGLIGPAFIRLGCDANRQGVVRTPLNCLTLGTGSTTATQTTQAYIQTPYWDGLHGDCFKNVNAVGTTILGGYAENCGGWGINITAFIGPTNRSNYGGLISGMDLESNTLGDINAQGNNWIFQNINSGSTGGIVFGGDRNQMWGGRAATITASTGAKRSFFLGADYFTSFTDGGTRTEWLSLCPQDDYTNCKINQLYDLNISGGKFYVSGTSSGVVTVAVSAAAGTWAFNLPTSAGTSGQPLLSGGGGVTAMTFGTLGLGGGGLGITSGTSGGIPYFSSTSTIASSGLLGQGNIVLGGGAGAAPQTMAALTDGQLVVGQTGSSPLGKTISGDWTLSAAGAATLATVNGNVGSFGSATQSPTYTVNAKGLITAAANVTITPAVGSITGLGTGVATALAVNVGTAGSFVVNGGALGSPSSAGTLPAFTLGGTIAGGGNQLNNIIIGTTTPLAGLFTTLGATSTITTTGAGTQTLTAISTNASDSVLDLKNSGQEWKIFLDSGNSNRLAIRDVTNSGTFFTMIASTGAASFVGTLASTGGFIANGTTGVNCPAGVTAGTVVVVLGIVTHC